MDPSYNNDSFGGTGIISNDAGMMTIPEKSSKKKWLILGVSLLLVVGIVAVVVFLMKNNSSANDSINQSYNRYTNYLVDGSDSNKAIEYSDWSSDYATERIMDNHDNEYVNELVQKYETFYNKYSSSDLAKDDTDEEGNNLLGSLIEGNKKSLSAIKAFVEKDNLTVDDLKGYSPTDGVSLEQYVADYYSDFSGSGSVTLMGFANLYENLAYAITINDAAEIEKSTKELKNEEKRLYTNLLYTSEWIYRLIKEEGLQG